MQSNLVNPRLAGTTIKTMDDFHELKNIHEFILYGDNILEGITLLNDMTQTDDILSLYGVIYEPIDQPIYLFQDEKSEIYAIKICGCYSKWKLPKEVTNLIEYIDLPDYIFYSIEKERVIIAGENTETASVGNSQWQREGRKLGAAKYHIPFIYQTFYSGKDESQDTIREPSSLQVYNQLIYSIRYRVPSLVAYFENNFEGAKTRNRTPEDCKDLFSKYLKTSLVASVREDYVEKRKGLEKEFFEHMINYLKEPKYDCHNISGKQPRLKKDFPVINDNVSNGLLNDTCDFAELLVDYIYNDNSDFISKYPIDDIVEENMKPWAGYNNKQWIAELIAYLTKSGNKPYSYISGQSKVGFAKTAPCKNYLLEKFPAQSTEIYAKLDDKKFSECIIMPLRIHKKSNGNLTFSPDPESGEIAAFGELFGYNYKGEKIRPVIGYVIVETPTNFKFADKVGTKLYKSIFEYVDVIVFNNKTLLTEYPYTYPTSNYNPVSIEKECPLELTEEMNVVSTYLNLSTIRSDWRLCFIHTHHSSWQQLVVHNPEQDIQHKIDRVFTKPDLIMQDKGWHFMIAEGKDHYMDLLRDKKIQTAMQNSAKIIDDLCKVDHTKFNAFIYNFSTPTVDPMFYVEREIGTVEEAIKRGHFKQVAYESDFVVIMVYLDQNRKTKFKLMYSPNFNANLKSQLDNEFSNEIYRQ